MARLLVHLSTLCRPESARGQLLTRPLSPLMRSDDDGVAGPGWYESSLDLQRGLQVRESGSDDRLWREWHEARRRLATAMPRQRPPASTARAHEPTLDLSLPAAVPVAASGASAPASTTGMSSRPIAAAPRVRYPGGLDFVV